LRNRFPKKAENNSLSRKEYIWETGFSRDGVRMRQSALLTHHINFYSSSIRQPLNLSHSYAKQTAIKYLIGVRKIAAVDSIYMRFIDKLVVIAPVGLINYAPSKISE
jgi:hypothetical protein